MRAPKHRWPNVPASYVPVWKKESLLNTARCYRFFQHWWTICLPQGLHSGDSFRKEDRQTLLKQLAEEERTMIFMNHRFCRVKTLADFMQYFGEERSFALWAVNSPKKFEENKRGTLKEIHDYFLEKVKRWNCDCGWWKNLLMNCVQPVHHFLFVSVAFPDFTNDQFVYTWRLESSVILFYLLLFRVPYKLQPNRWQQRVKYDMNVDVDVTTEQFCRRNKTGIQTILPIH